METLELCAIHESGRIILAFEYGFIIEQTELSTTDIGGGKTVLLHPNYGTLIKEIFNSQEIATGDQFVDLRINLANQLYDLFCIGACCSALYENDLQLNEQLNIDFPGSDHRQLMLIESFLKKFDSAFTEEKLNQTANRLLKTITSEKFIKAINELSKMLINAENLTSDKTSIENLLRNSGIERKNSRITPTTSIHLMEDDAKKGKESEDISESEKKLNATLNKFISGLNSSLTEIEKQESIKFLKRVFENYNG